MQSFTSGHALQKRVRRWRRVDMIIFSLALSLARRRCLLLDLTGAYACPTEKMCSPGWHRVPSDLDLSNPPRTDVAQSHVVLGDEHCGTVEAMRFGSGKQQRQQHLTPSLK